MITDMKKLCPGCIKLNKKSFAAFEANIPDVLKSVQLLSLSVKQTYSGPS